MVNDDNYIEEVTTYFIQMRGHHSAISPKDWVIVESWREQGIPLKVVFQGIDETVVNKPGTSRLTLEQCNGNVLKCWESYRALMQGKNRAPETDEPPDRVIKRLVPLLLSKVSQSIQTGLNEWFPGSADSIFKKVTRHLGTFEEKILAGEYTDYPGLVQAMEELQHAIMQVLEGLDKTSQYDYSAIDRSNNASALARICSSR